MSIKAIFLSSTARDLALYREAVQQAAKGPPACYQSALAELG